MDLGSSPAEIIRVDQEQTLIFTSVRILPSRQKDCVDSSSYGLGATPMQWDEDRLIPTVYASRTLTDAERRYAQIEKKCLASTWACEKCAKYLIGLDSFQLQTDHKPLVPLIERKYIDSCAMSKTLDPTYAIQYRTSTCTGQRDCDC